MAYKAYGNIMGLLEYDRHEEVSILLGRCLTRACRRRQTRRYAGCVQSEASDPDFWALVNYGPADEGSPAEEGQGGNSWQGCQCQLLTMGIFTLKWFQEERQDG